MSLSSLHRVSGLVRRALPVPWQVVRARLALRACTSVGPLTRVASRWPMVHNDGAITVGGRGVINSRYAPVALQCGTNAALLIGDRHVINFGTAISAAHRVTIGNDVTIGPYCIIDDHHLDPTSHPSGAPITIGDQCWLASRVVVLPGASIGDRSVIAAGSIVDGAVPSDVLYGGAPARILKHLDRTRP